MCEFAYVDPDPLKYLKGITNAYKKQYQATTTPMQRFQQAVRPLEETILETSGLPPNRVLPPLPLSSNARTAKEGKMLGQMLMRKHPASGHIKSKANTQMLKRAQLETEYGVLTKETPKGKVAVGVRHEYYDPVMRGSSLSVIGHPKYTGDVLASTLDHVNANPGRYFEATPLTPRHRKIYEKAVSRRNIPNLRIK